MLKGVTFDVLWSFFSAGFPVPLPGALFVDFGGVLEPPTLHYTHFGATWPPKSHFLDVPFSRSFSVAFSMDFGARQVQTGVGGTGDAPLA